VIIDVHVHTRSPGHRYQPDEIATSIRLARQAGIDHVVQLHNLIGHPANDDGYTVLSPSPTVVQQSNNMAMQIVAEHPDFYSGFCYLNPAHEQRFILEEIERCVVAGNLRGIKLWVAVRATDARLDPLMERAAELAIPVLHHAWYKADGQVGNESTAAEVADLARRHPRVSIIMAHLGGVRWRGVLDIRPNHNVLVDTSGSQPLSGLVEYAVAQLGAERVVFGSDWPLRSYTVQKARVSGAHISEREKACILGENAARLLRLDTGGRIPVTAKDMQYA